jgi:hypothetical protein
LQNKVFVQGPANSCNVRRFLTVPVPPHALTELFTGQAPVLLHRPEDASIAWDSGSFLIAIASQHDAREEIRLEPHPSDWNKPWSEQRVRVLEVAVTQRGTDLYRVELAGHEAAPMARPYSDPDGIDPDVPPSGPQCTAEIPRRLRFVSPVAGHDVIFDHKEVVHNPPVRGSVFQLQAPRGVKKQMSNCQD